MSYFAGMEDMLQDFISEAGELLGGVDNKLAQLEKSANDAALLNDIFRDFHTIKGGAGFLNVTPLVELCHLTERLFDLLRNGKLTLSGAIMAATLSATGAVRDMFEQLAHAQPAAAADVTLIARLQAAINGEAPEPKHVAVAANDNAVRAATPAAGPRVQMASMAPTARVASIRVNTHRLDQVLNLSLKVGLTGNLLDCLRHALLAGQADCTTLSALDRAVNRLDLLVRDLQTAVMKTRHRLQGTRRRGDQATQWRLARGGGGRRTLRRWYGVDGAGPRRAARQPAGRALRQAIPRGGMTPACPP